MCLFVCFVLARGIQCDNKAIAPFVATTTLWLWITCRNRTMSTICIWFCLFRRYWTQFIKLSIFILPDNHFVVGRHDISTGLRITKQKLSLGNKLFRFYDFISIDYFISTVDDNFPNISLLMSFGAYSHEVCTSFSVPFQFMVDWFSAQTVRTRKKEEHSISLSFSYDVRLHLMSNHK